MSGSATKGNNILYLYRFGSAEFDQAKFELRLEGKPVDADRRPLELLNLLLEHLGEVLTRDELYETLWQNEDVGEGAIANAVSRLRRHLGKENAAFIVTRPKVGYSFTGKVERIAQNTPTESAVALSAGDLVPGQPEYRLDQLLSVSGNKKREVWLASSVTDAPPHVFKFTLDADGLRQLKREYTLSELLSSAPSTSDNVTRVCGRNFEQPPFYIEYPYAGQDLLSWSEESNNLTNRSRAARLELFLNIADTVSAAHDLGVLHKDIKPANILMSESPKGVTPLLTDFGSSHLMQKDILAEHGVSPLGMSVSFDALPSSAGGTLMYLAPEVWTGGSPGIRSDVYALGIMLYQIIAGDLRQGIPSDWRDRIGDELLADDIQQATSSAPEERLKSVGELTSRLRNLEERRQVAEEQARKEEDIRLTREALSRSQARRPWLIAASLTLVVGLATSLLLYKNAVTAQQEAERQTARAEAINEFWQEEIIQGGNPYAKDQASITDILMSASNRVGEAFKDDPVTAGSIYESLGTAFAGLNKYDQLKSNSKLAIEAYSKAYGPKSPELWEKKLKNSIALAALNKISDSDKILEEFTSSSFFNDSSFSKLNFYFKLAQANILSQNQEWSLAAKEYSELLNSSIILSIEPRELIDLHLSLITAYSNQQDFEKSQEIMDNLMSMDLNFSKARLTSINIVQSGILIGAKKYEEAEELLLKTRDYLATQKGALTRESTTVAHNLSRLYSATANETQALFFSEEAYEISKDILPEGHKNILLFKLQYGFKLHSNQMTDRAIHVLESSYKELAERSNSASLYLHAISYILAEAYLLADNDELARQQIAEIDPDKLQANQPTIDSKKRLNILDTILTYRSENNEDALVTLSEAREYVEGCECILEVLINNELNDTTQFLTEER